MTRPGLFHVSQRTRRIFGLDPNRDELPAAIHDHEGFDRQVQRAQVEVPYHADDGLRHADAELDLFSQGLFGRIPAQDSEGGLVEQDFIRFGLAVQRTAERPAGQQFQAQSLRVARGDDNALEVVLDLVRIINAPGRFGGDPPDVPLQSGQVDSLARVHHPIVPEQFVLPGLVSVCHLGD